MSFACAIIVRAMNIVTPRYRAVLEGLLHRLEPHECDPAEYELARHLHALPLGLDLFSLCFITPEGETIRVETTDSGEKVTRGNSPQELFRFMVTSVDRYPGLATLIPERPADATECPHCEGSQLSRISVDCSTGQASPCFPCVGMGWVLRKWD